MGGLRWVRLPKRWWFSKVIDRSNWINSHALGSLESWALPRPDVDLFSWPGRNSFNEHEENPDQGYCNNDQVSEPLSNLPKAKYTESIMDKSEFTKKPINTPGHVLLDHPPAWTLCTVSAHRQEYLGMHFWEGKHHYAWIHEEMSSRLYISKAMWTAIFVLWDHSRFC